MASSSIPSTAAIPTKAVAVTNVIPVNEGHEIDFEDRFSKRVHLVDRAPGFIRNEVMRPTALAFDHATGKWIKTKSSTAGLYYRVTTWWRTMEDFENWTKSSAFAEAHSNRAPKDMFAGPSKLEIHEVFLSTNLPPPRPASLPKRENGATTSGEKKMKRQEHPSSSGVSSKGASSPNARMYDGLPMINLDELAKHRSGPRIYIGLCGLVYDVSSSPDFYGEGGPYHVFAGRDATRGLAFGYLDEAQVLSRPGDQSDLGTSQEMMLDDWIEQFDEKYPVVARLLVPGGSNPSGKSKL